MRDVRFDPGAGCGGGEDVLPDLLHGRLAGEARARAEAHVAACAACAAELALLRSARGAIVAAAPPVDVAAIAASVRAATVQMSDAGAQAAVPSTAPAPAARPVVPLAARTRWRGPRHLRALAATLLVALGAGAGVYGWSSRGVERPADPGAPTATVAASAASAASATNVPSGARGPSADATVAGVTAPGDRAVLAAAEPALGARFDDLSDEELQAVIAAVDGSDASLVSFEPDPETPAVPGGV